MSRMIAGAGGLPFIQPVGPENATETPTSSSSSSSPSSSVSSASALLLTLPPTYNEEYDHFAAIDPLTCVSIEQFVLRVSDVSSQYGSDPSISFTANNIIGEPSKYPSYGDFPETFALGSYGRWSQLAPSHRVEFMPQTVPRIAPQDFITLEFEEYVRPTRLAIYETYNPGSVCEVWAYDSRRCWNLLWRLPTDGCDADIQTHPSGARIFQPPLAHMTLPTRCIRLHFAHRHLDYYAELDAVLLVGLRMSRDFKLQRDQQQGRIQRNLVKAGFQTMPSGDADDAAEAMDEFLNIYLGRFEALVGLRRDDINLTTSHIERMPHEILLKIAGYLDLISLCRLAATCNRLRSIACDPILYTSLNFRPYWSACNRQPGFDPDTNLLTMLQPRCSLIRQLDLSWTGSSMVCSITPPDICAFIHACGATLRQLRLDSCQHLHIMVLRSAANLCTHLTELSLRNFENAPYVEVDDVRGLRQLQRLDVYRTAFTTDVLVALLAGNPALRHLNVAHSGLQTNMDAVAVQLAATNCRLVSLNMWKSYRLTAVGLAALVACAELQELDIGWCIRNETALGDSLQLLLASECGPKLRRLGLASIRGLVAEDLDAIARRCGRLQQLELMGIRGVSPDKCFDILISCSALQLLDLSFCDSIDATVLAMLRDRYPHVAIKRSWTGGDD